MQKFKMGTLVATNGAMEAVTQDEMMRAVSRHLGGDWGDLDAQDKQMNDYAVRNGDRILSSYKTESGTKFWIITEADRSSTTILLPSEY